MGLPMYVSPSPSKRQLPSKQPTSPPYTPQAEEDFEEAYQNSRTSAFGNGRDFVFSNIRFEALCFSLNLSDS